MIGVDFTTLPETSMQPLHARVLVWRNPATATLKAGQLVMSRDQA